MKWKKLKKKLRLGFSIPPLFFLTLSFLANVVHAEDQIDLTSIPEYLGQQLGIDTFSAGILASAILILMWLIPIVILIRGRASIFVSMVASIVLMSFAVAIGWLPIFTLILIILLIAGLWGNKAKGWFT